MNLSKALSLPWCKSPDAAKDSPFHADVFDSITAVSPFIWEQLVPADKLFFTIPYLSAFEQSISGNIGFRYLVMYYQGKPAGVAISQLLTFDGNNIGIDEGEQKATWGKRLLTRLANQFSFKMLVLGNSFMTGEYALTFKDDVEASIRLNLLEYGLKVLTNNEKKSKALSAIVLKDFFVYGDNNVPKPLVQKGYLEVMVQPDMIMNINPAWATFDDYLNAMASKYRVRARKAIKQMDGIETKLMDGAEIDRQMPIMEQLYGQIIGNASFKLATFDLQHIPCLQKTLSTGFYCLGFYKQDKLVGFISLYDNEHGELIAGMMGMEKALQREHDLYLNILYSIVRFAIEHRNQKLVMGRTAMEIKSSIGAEPHDMYVYMKHLNPLMNAIIKPIVRSLTRTKPWHQRTPFKD